MVCKNINDFEKRWELICDKIEKQEFGREQARTIIEDFLNEWEIFLTECDDEEGLAEMMSEITTKLNLALQIAISNYEKRNKPSWIQKIFGKPEIKIDFNAIKNQIG